MVSTMAYHTYQEYSVKNQLEYSLAELKIKSSEIGADYEKCSTDYKVDKEQYDKQLAEMEPTNKQLKEQENALKVCKGETIKLKV